MKLDMYVCVVCTFIDLSVTRKRIRYVHSAFWQLPICIVRNEAKHCSFLKAAMQKKVVEPNVCSGNHHVFNVSSLVTHVQNPALRAQNWLRERNKTEGLNSPILHKAQKVKQNST